MRKYKIINKILVAAIIVLLAHFAANYILNSFLPQKIKAAVEKFAADTLDSRVEINQTRISILRGIFFQDVSFYQKGEKNPYVKIKKFRAIPSYAALLAAKKIVISLKVNDAYLALKRNENGEFIFPQIKNAPANETASPDTGKKPQGAAPGTVKAPAAKEPLFLIKNITVKKLNLGLEDKTANFTKTFEDIFIQANLDKFPQINFSLHWGDKLALTGKYIADTNYLQASCSLQQINLPDFNPYFKGFSLKNAVLKTAQLTLEGKDTYVIKGNAKLKGIELNYPLNNPDKISQIAEFKGDLNLDIETKAVKQNFSYRIGGSLLDGQAQNLPVIDKLAGIKSNFILDNNKLEISYLTADFPLAKSTLASSKTPQALRLQAKGELSFSNSDFYCEITSGSTLLHFIQAAKSVKSFTFNYEGKGDITLKAMVKGNFKQNALDYYVEYQIRDAQFKDASGIDANGFIKKDKLTLEKCSLNYKDMPVKLKGEIENFVLPVITLNAQSDTAKLDLKAKYHADAIAIEYLALKIADSKIGLQGTIGNKIEPEMKLEGLANIDLKDSARILKLFNLKYPLLEKLDPRGMFKAKFILEGEKNISQWQVKLAGLADKVKVYGVTATDIKIELYRDKNEAIISPLVANVARGALEARLKLDYLNKKTTLNVLINDLDLSEIKNELKLKAKDLSGLLSLDIKVDNNGLSGWNTMDGGGKITIKEGNIWEINFLKGLGQFLFISEFESIVFEEGYSDLIFKGENVIFENTELKSSKMTLRGKGRISLKGDLNFGLVAEFNPNLIASSESLNKIITNILSQNTLAITLEGTLEKPSYKIKPVFFSDLKGIEGLLEKILK